MRQKKTVLTFCMSNIWIQMRMWIWKNECGPTAIKCNQIITPCTNVPNKTMQMPQTIEDSNFEISTTFWIWMEWKCWHEFEWNENVDMKTDMVEESGRQWIWRWNNYWWDCGWQTDRHTRTHSFRRRSCIWNVKRWKNTSSNSQPILRYESIRKIGFRLFDYDFYDCDRTVKSQTFAFSLTISVMAIRVTLLKPAHPRK